MEERKKVYEGRAEVGTSGRSGGYQVLLSGSQRQGSCQSSPVEVAW